MPCTKISLRSKTDRRYIRANGRSNRFILAEIVAPHAHETAERKRPPVNLAFVLDRSGSMAGMKIVLAKQAVVQSIGRLQAEDRFSVVVYDDVIDVVVASTLATAEAKSSAIGAIAGINARNGTNLGEGWLRGCEQVALHLAQEGVNRTLLLTDGLANIGITDNDELATHAANLRQRGIQTTTFGVGADFNEVLLEAMATAGGGNYYYIAEAAQITDCITSEVGEALDVVARDVTLDITSPETLSVQSLSPFPFEQRGQRTVVNLGSLVAEQVVQVVLRLEFPYGDVGRETGVVVSMTARGDVANDASESLAWEYADTRMNDVQDRDAEVDRAVASIFAARARQEATNLNRSGDFEAAQAALSAVAKRIRGYAGRDKAMRAMIDELELDASQLAHAMPAAALKEMRFRSYASAKMRNLDGTALRRHER